MSPFASAIPASQSARLGHDEFYYLKRQLVAAALGVGLLLLALRLGTRRIAALAYPILGVTVLTLLLVPLVGKSAGGAQRWICSPLPAAQVREVAAAAKGHAVLFRGADKSPGVFAPLAIRKYKATTTR